MHLINAFKIYLKERSSGGNSAGNSGGSPVLFSFGYG